MYFYLLMNKDFIIIIIIIIIISLGAIVAMNNTLFRGNSGVAKRALSIVNADVVRIENCSFKNNFGGADGSRLSVQLRSTRLTIFKTNL